MLLREDEWLAKRLGVKCYALSYNSDAVGECSVIESQLLVQKACWENEDLPCFVYSKILTQNTNIVEVFQENGFRVVDTHIQFEHTGESIRGNCDQAINFRYAKPEDEEDVSDIARKTFRYSRFHLDNMIPNKIADDLKSDWARNFFLNKRGDHMIIAECKGEIAGFAQLLVRGESLIIDLIAVQKKFQGKRIGFQMLLHILDLFSARFSIVVGTQVANIASLRLYENAGFLITSSSYILHYHYQK